MKLSTKANLLFFLITAIWGATFPLIKAVIHDIQPLLFVALRFGLASFVLIILIFPYLKKIDTAVLQAGLILGLLNSACYGFQTISLQYISASRCAFITGVGVILVPLFSAIFKLSTLRWIDLLAALVCLFGLYWLTGASLSALNKGDLLAFLCAISWALSIVYLQKYSEAHYSSPLLAFFQIFFSIPIPFLMSFSALTHMHLAWSVIATIAFCAIIATIIPIFVQTRYQRDTTATQAALIFSLEPVFASLYACLFFHEIVTRHLLMGGVFILLSIILPVIRR